MPRFAAFIRGINVGGHGTLSMADVRATCESLGLTNVKTYLQSGNVVFDGTAAQARKLEQKIGKTVMLRTPDELQNVIAANPFPAELKINPALLVVMFLADKPNVATIAWNGPETAHLLGRELYVWYPNGQGKSKFSLALVEKTLGVAATARNFNTVTAMLGLLSTHEPSARPARGT